MEDFAPRTTSINRKRRPWRFRPDPLVEELGEVRHSGPSFAGPAGSMLKYHIREATQAPKRSRGIKFLKLLILICLILFIIFAWITTYG